MGGVCERVIVIEEEIMRRLSSYRGGMVALGRFLSFFFLALIVSCFVKFILDFGEFFKGFADLQIR